MKKRAAILIVFLSAALLLSACNVSLPSVQKPVETAPMPTESTVADTPETPEVIVETINTTYTVITDGVEYHEQPQFTEENLLGTLNRGDKVSFIDKDGDYLRVRLPNGGIAWVYGYFLKADDAALQAQRYHEALEKEVARSGFTAISGEPTYTVMANILNCRSGPSTSSAVLTQINFGTVVTVLGTNGDFYLCRLQDGVLVYCSSSYLSLEPTYVDVKGAEDLRVFLPAAEFELVYAGPDNLTGEALIPDIPLLESETASKLLDAFRAFRNDGYTIKIFDAYHPMSAQRKIFNAASDTSYIEDPDKIVSVHSQGRAVDITLVYTNNNRELEMPTAIYDLSGKAARANSEDWTENAAENVAYLTRIMEQLGFSSSEGNWWHFEYKGTDNSMDNELDYTSLKSIPVSEYNK